MKNKLKIICFLFLIQTGLTAKAQEPVLGASLEEDTIMIGDQIHLRLEIATQKEDKRLYLAPGGSEEMVKGIEILGLTGDTIILEEKKLYQFDYRITGFDSGLYQIPEIPVFVSQRGENDTLFSNPLELRIISPAIDTTQAIKAIKPPINTPFTLGELMLYREYLIGGAIFILLVFAVIWFFINRKKISFRTEPKIPAHQKALERLDYLKKEKMWQNGQVKTHYTILSDTIRIYIEERYGIRAMESLTQEIIRDFRKYEADDEMLTGDLEELLNMSDLVKFAREDPSPAENETNLNKAYIFIEKTREVAIEDKLTEEK